MYKVIIIEDDPMVASINKQYVELTSSFHVEATFKNGILALQYLQNCTVDLIILDCYTPQMNGDEFIDQLHAAGMTHGNLCQRRRNRPPAYFPRRHRLSRQTI